MAADTAVERRANLLASRARWGKVDRHADEPPNTGGTADYKQDSIQKWLFSINKVDEKVEPVQRSAAEPLRRNASAEDDLVLGVEASIYGNPGARTVKEFLRSSQARSALPRWNSLTSAFSTQSSTLSVMDVLNLWTDDPEEVLLDLGFGVEEPDITGRIPARFINNQSQAHGINLQVFLEAQKNRMDIENPDVRSRFRQLEVLHQVTTAFNSLVGGGASGAPASSRGPLANMSPEAREKRKRMGMLLRRASKKTLSLARASQEQPPPSPSLDSTAESEQPSPQSMPVATHLSEKRGALKRSRPSLVENGCLTPLMEEQGPLPEASEADSQAQAVVSTVGAEESVVRPRSIREARPQVPPPPLRKRSPGEAMESFELEEIQSFDEGSVSGSGSGVADCIGEGERGFLSRAESSLVRTSSCQSDSSGFLEEPFIPVLAQSSSPGPELMKALNAMSSSTDSQGTLRGSQEPSPTTPTFPSPVFTSPPPARQPETPASDLAESTAPPLGKGSPVDVPTAEPSAQDDDSVMGSSQCCESPEGVMCVDSIIDRPAEHGGLTRPAQASVAQEGGQQPSSELNSEREQHVRERPISAVLEPTVSEEGVGARDEHLTSEVSTDDGVVSLIVSVSGRQAGALRACGVAEEEAAERVVSEPAESSERVQCERVLSGGRDGGNAVCDCAATGGLSVGVSESVVRECEHVSEHAVKADAHVGCSHSSSALKACPSTGLDAREQVSDGDCAGQSQKTGHKMKECDTVTVTDSLQSTGTEEGLTVSCDYQVSGGKGLSSKHAFFQQEAKCHSSKHGPQMPTSETSQPVVPFEGEGTSVDGDVVPKEPFGTDGRPRLPGRSVSVQMRSSLAPISQTALWKGVALDSIFRSSDVAQRRESFSRRAWSEAEAQPAPQSLAEEIPELASAAPVWQSQDSSQGHGKFPRRSFSLDTGLSWEDGDGRLDGVMMAGKGTRWCRCQCLCCVQHGPHTLLSEPASSLPYSLDELEEMMRGVKRFRAVLTEVEERLGHEQALVYEDLSVGDREELSDVLELRAAVKQEARELELQLAELVHHYDDSFKMKINRLLDEQSHLCSQLRIHSSDSLQPESAPSCSVAIQCSLLPVTDTIDTCPPLPGSSGTTKQGKLDFVGFIQNLKNSLHQSISSDSLE